MRVFVLLTAIAYAAAFVSQKGSLGRPSKSWMASEVVLEATNKKLSDLNVGIIGAGPSGLLLAHLLLKEGAKVSIYERRSDQRANEDGKALAGFAYALGLGIRGRSALRAADEELWQAVKAIGNECDRFRLHAGPLNIKLRDSDPSSGLEPSLLLFQSDLCAALLNELELRYGDDNRSRVFFESQVAECDISRKSITVQRQGKTTTDSFDLLVGCDGVNSIVRDSLADLWPEFETEKTALPGEFKCVKLPSVPPMMDAEAVALVIPKKGSATAFVEPTVDGTCCVLFAGRGEAEDSILASWSNQTALEENLQESFPLLEGADFSLIARELQGQKAGRASSVQCNIYHYSDAVALVGDAAHATGGVSGQGVNSALLDAAALSECISQSFDGKSKKDSLGRALLAYSQRQVPEGKALYDLSFGPKPTGVLKLRYGLKQLSDTIFQGRFGVGKKPLQTQLTTSLEPFSTIRRNLDKYYEERFPESSDFNSRIAEMSKDVAIAEKMAN